MAVDRLSSALDEHVKGGHALAEGDEDRLLAAVPFVKDRAKTVLELADQCAFALARRPLAFTDNARAALTGGAVSPDLAKILSALGQAESLARLDDALSSVA